MKFVPVALLSLAAAAHAATITVTITGATGEIHVGEGPILGHRSYQTIPGGMPFVLTYTFDEDKGKQSISATENGLITQSGIESTPTASPGTSATLQIGRDSWEFGRSSRSHVTLSTSGSAKAADFAFISAGGNHVSAHIVPGKGGYWPKNGDWRSSFTTEPVDGSTASFVEDNDRVSARGALVPASLTVSGVDIDGQWLRTPAPEQGKWQLGHPSRLGGYIVEEVSRTMLGTRADGSAIAPSQVTYWQAWQVPPGADAPANASSVFEDTVLAGGAGEETIHAVARFYEGLSLPSAFAKGNSPYAGSAISSIRDPHLSTQSATLPVMIEKKQRF
jgi:hypothetical protein